MVNGGRSRGKKRREGRNGRTSFVGQHTTHSERERGGETETGGWHGPVGRRGRGPGSPVGVCASVRGLWVVGCVRTVRTVGCVGAGVLLLGCLVGRGMYSVLAG